jgi:Ca-activated chloride channel family protein
MRSPQIELTSVPAAIGFGCPTTLDVLVRIVPPQAEFGLERPRLNLGLVIDRSSSMSVKHRLVYAKAAARQIVEELTPVDRISIHTFDYSAQTLLPSTLAINKPEIIDIIQSIETGKWTNLHAGWVEGGQEINRHIYPETVNRLIVLSDGWASAGVRDRRTIAAHAQDLAQMGISTTTVGVGDDYNEDLLEAMAIAGDGNYYYVNLPEHLSQVFQKEIQALVATQGQAVTLGIEPQGEVEIQDVLNDLDLNHQARFKLPNLVAGYPFNVVVRLKIPAMTQATELCYFRLSWNDHKHSEPQALRVSLQLPIVEQSLLNEVPISLEVQQQVALMLGARAKRKAIALVDRGNYEAAQSQIQAAKELILAAPTSSLLQLEVLALERLEANLRARQLKQFRKSSHYQAFTTTSGFDQTSEEFS